MYSSSHIMFKDHKTLIMNFLSFLSNSPKAKEVHFNIFNDIYPYPIAIVVLSAILKLKQYSTFVFLTV